MRAPRPGFLVGFLLAASTAAAQQVAYMREDRPTARQSIQLYRVKVINSGASTTPSTYGGTGHLVWDDALDCPSAVYADGLLHCVGGPGGGDTLLETIDIGSRTWLRPKTDNTRPLYLGGVRPDAGAALVATCMYDAGADASCVRVNGVAHPTGVDAGISDPLSPYGSFATTDGGIGGSFPAPSDPNGAWRPDGWTVTGAEGLNCGFDTFTGAYGCSHEIGWAYFGCGGADTPYGWSSGGFLRMTGGRGTGSGCAESYASGSRIMLDSIPAVEQVWTSPLVDLRYVRTLTYDSVWFRALNLASTAEPISRIIRVCGHEYTDTSVEVSGGTYQKTITLTTACLGMGRVELILRKPTTTFSDYGLREGLHSCQWAPDLTYHVPCTDPLAPGQGYRSFYCMELVGGVPTTASDLWCRPTHDLYTAWDQAPFCASGYGTVSGCAPHSLVYAAPVWSMDNLVLHGYGPSGEPVAVDLLRSSMEVDATRSTQTAEAHAAHVQQTVTGNVGADGGTTALLVESTLKGSTWSGATHAGASRTTLTINDSQGEVSLAQVARVQLLSGAGGSGAAGLTDTADVLQLEAHVGGDRTITDLRMLRIPAPEVTTGTLTGGYQISLGDVSGLSGMGAISVGGLTTVDGSGDVIIGGTSAGGNALYVVTGTSQFGGAARFDAALKCATDAGTSTKVLHGGASACTYSAVSLTADVSGILGVANGGTGADLSATGGSGKYVTQASLGGVLSVASAGALTKTDDTNVTLTLGGAPTTALLAAASITAGWTGTLSAARGGFGADTSGATSGAFARFNGTSWGGSTSTIPTSAGATVGKVLASDGTNYVLSTPAFPTSASATARKIIVSDGTNWVASTETYATPGTSGNVLTSDGTNWTSSAAAAAASSVTIADDNATNATMYPTWVTANTGNLPIKVSSTGITWNPSTQKLIVTGSTVSPTIIAGTATSSTLTLESTSGAGATDAILFKTGSQAERGRITTTGQWGIGPGAQTPLATTTIQLDNAGAQNILLFSDSSVTKGSFGTSHATNDILTGSAAGDFVWRSEAAIRVGTGGNNLRLYLPSGGGLGIGTTTVPSGSVLYLKKGSGAGTDVSDSNGIVQYSSDTNATNFWFNTKTAASGGTNATIGFAVNGAIKHGLIYDIANNALVIERNAGEAGGSITHPDLVVASGGNVGVGVLAPTSMFSVGSTSQFQVNSSGNIVKLNNVTTSFPSSQGAASTVLSNDGSGNLSWSTAASLSIPTGTGTDKYLAIWSGATSQVAKSFLQVDSSSSPTQLGIGAAPSYMLHVKNATTSADIAVDATGTANYSQISVRQPSNTASAFSFQVYGSTAAGTRFGINNANTAQIVTNASGGSALSDLLIGTTDNVPIVFGVNNVAKAYVTSTGLGIGQSSPADKLHVSTAGGLSQIIVGGTNAASEYSAVQLRGTNTKKNWIVGVSYNSNGLELTPSTAAAGTTFSTPALYIDESSNVTVGSTTTTSKFNVGSSAQFQVDASGNITAMGNFTQTGSAALTTGTGAVTVKGSATWDANKSITLTSGTGVYTQTYAPAANSGATNTAMVLNLTTPADSSGTNTHQAINIVPTVGNATAGTNAINLINVAAFTGDAQVTTTGLKLGNETSPSGSDYAINIGTGWDRVFSSANFTVTQAGAGVLAASLTTPIDYGGTAASSTKSIFSTSGSGTSDAIIFGTGSQVERWRIDTYGTLLTQTGSYIDGPFGGVGYIQNRLLYSQSFGNAAWTKESTIAITANSDTAPDGSTTADKVSSGGAASTNAIYQADAAAIDPSSLAWTGSVWMKMTSGSATVNLRINTGSTTGTAQACAVTTTWQRFVVTQSFGAAQTGAAVLRIETGTNTNVLLWQAQLAQASSPPVDVFTTAVSVSAEDGGDLRGGSFGGVLIGEFLSYGRGISALDNASGGKQFINIGVDGTRSILMQYNEGGGGADSAVLTTYGVDLTLQHTGTNAIVLGGNTIVASGKTLTVNSAASLILAGSSSPASGAACTTGTITWDSSYLYVCTASAAWKRAALSGGY